MGIAQLVERHPSKSDVAGSSPVSHSNLCVCNFSTLADNGWVLAPLGIFNKQCGDGSREKYLSVARNPLVNVEPSGIYPP